MAGYALDVEWVFVVASEFFANFDFSAAEIEQAAANASPFQIRLTRVVDEFGAAPAYAGIGTPAAAESGDIGFFSRIEPVGLSRGDVFSSVLDHLFAGGNLFGRENAVTMNTGTTEAETITGDFGVNSRAHSVRSSLRGGTALSILKFRRDTPVGASRAGFGVEAV